MTTDKAFKELKEELTKEEIAELEAKKELEELNKKRMTTSKFAFWLGFLFAFGLVIFSCVMIVINKDTPTVSVLGGAGVAAIPFLFSIYRKNSTAINLKHMELDYNPNYDDDHNLY